MAGGWDAVSGLTVAKHCLNSFLIFFGTGQTYYNKLSTDTKNNSNKQHLHYKHHKDYKQIVLDLLPEITEGQLIIEEERRNTAPSSLTHRTLFRK